MNTNFSAATLLQQGHDELDRGQYKLALATFQEAATLEPQNHQILYAIGLAYYRLDRYQEAIEPLNRALAIQPDYTLALAWRGIVYQQLNQPELAQADFKGATQITPQDYEGWRGRGIAFYGLKRYEEAIADYDKAIALNPDYHIVYYNRGNSLKNLGRYEEAIAEYDKAIVLNPDDHLAYHNRGNSLANLGRYEEAIADYNKAIILNPNDHLAYHNRGISLNNLGRYNEAIADYDKAIALNPNDHHAYNGRGNSLNNLGRYDEAIADYNKAIALNSDYHYAYNNRGNSLNNLGRYDEAIADLDKAISLNPDYHHAYNNRGNSLNNLGRYDEAIADLDKAIALNPDYHLAYNNRGNSLNNLGRYDEAIAEYDKAIALNSDYDDAYNGRGNSLYYLGRYDEASADYDKAIALNPNYHIAYYNRGNLLRNLGRYDEAIAEYDKTIEIKPDYWQARFNLGIAYYNRGQQQANPFTDWFKAKASYEQALKYLTGQNLPQEYLQVLQRLIEVCRYLLPAPQVEELWQKGADRLGQWLQNPNLSLGQRITLERKFASFNQVRVDALANSNNPKNQLKALELAEQRKNTCITWLHQQNLNEAPKLRYAEMQKLLQPRTAAIYWHVSPAGITTFIIKHNRQPQIFTPSPAPQSRQVSLQTQAYPPHAYQLQEFQKWMQEWRQSYRDYHQGNFPPEIVEKENAPWRQNIKRMLIKLGKILDIQGLIKKRLVGIKQVILIPHRELHLLPLRFFFDGSFTTTYLPTFQVGLNLKRIQPNPHQKSLLNVENSLNELPFTAIESIAISACHSQTSILTNPTPTELLQQLTSNSGYFHFAGHAAHEPEEPRASALDLGNSEKLTLGDIFDQKLDFNQYQLICLSACETGITSTQSLLDEYVGFVSGFLAKGSQYVVSTLWTVDERSAALLMIEFYQKLSQLTPPLALKEAQEWLRSVTYEKLAEWYQQLAATLREQAAKNSAIPHCCAYLETEAQIILADSVKMASSEPPFQSPYHWAGFTIHGNLT